MDQTTPSRLSRDTAERRARAFGDWLRAELLRRGYDLSIRGGGQSRLARETGLGNNTVSRLVNGTARNPGPDTLRRLAEALALPFGEILVRAGTLTRDQLRAIQDAPEIDRPPISVDEAADELGITDPVARTMFEASVGAARDVQQQRLGRERAD